jgi:hypothetical protein
MAASLKEQGLYTSTHNPNKGLILIYRKTSMFAESIGISIKANGKRLGALDSGTYFVYEADPGPVTVAAEGWFLGDRTCTIDVEPGKQYYIQGTLALGFPLAVPSLAIVNDIEGKEAIKGLKYSTWQ